MTKLEQLTSEIRKAVPRLMELNDGQKVRLLGTINFEYIVGHDANLSKIDNEIRLSDGYDYELTEFEIIGHEPLLSDVLKWLVVINADVHGINKFGLLHKITWQYCSQWDLSKPHLKDQSQDSIDYLHSLIN